MSKVNAAVPPPGEALSDFEIFLRLARELGCCDELFRRLEGAADAFEEWKRVSEGRLCDYSGITYEALEEFGGIQWPFPKNADSPAGAARRLYTDGKFQTADGKAQLFCVDWEPFPEQPSPDFPFVLNTGRTVEHWHTRTKTGAVPILEQMSPRAWLEMNPADAKRLTLRPHDLVDVVSTRGRVRRVELRVTEVIAPGPGVCALSLRRVEHQRGDTGHLRSDLARAELQTMRRASGEVNHRSGMNISNPDQKKGEQNE